LPVFDGGILALDETAEVKKEDVRNKCIVVRIKQNNFYISIYLFGTSVGNDIIFINKFVTEFG
jgi:hypothetical protein